jgi:hypothetical protein
LICLIGKEGFHDPGGSPQIVERLEERDHINVGLRRIFTQIHQACLPPQQQDPKQVLRSVGHGDDVGGNCLFGYLFLGLSNGVKDT